MNFNRSTPEVKYYQNKRIQTKKSHELISNSQITLNKDLRRVTNPVNKSTCVKQIWIPKCLFTLLKNMNDLKGPKQVWVLGLKIHCLISLCKNVLQSFIISGILIAAIQDT